MNENPNPEPPARSRWEQLAGADSGAGYAARFERLAASGQDVHGEATFCTSLVDPGGTVLDAGCGTGRVAIRLDELGYDVVGVDVDSSMLAVARERAPHVPWHEADLAGVRAEDLDGAEGFDLVVLAGNVIPLLAPGTCPVTVASLAALTARGGLVVAGFGLDSAHLPAGCEPTPLAEYDDAAAAAGLTLVDRFATWDREPFEPGGGYAVSVHRR
ncbi:MAG TPA: class I SAM-dependent methyltransferase [Nocardioidaceae bacterium]|nr:class I SAM-dependent methyltransferase [Nocardioidaceae bacterium]